MGNKVYIYFSIVLCILISCSRKEESPSAIKISDIDIIDTINVNIVDDSLDNIQEYTKKISKIFNVGIEDSMSINEAVLYIKKNSLLKKQEFSITALDKEQVRKIP